MKRILSLVILMALVLGLATACGEDEEQDAWSECEVCHIGRLRG